MRGGSELTNIKKIFVWCLDYHYPLSTNAPLTHRCRNVFFVFDDAKVGTKYTSGAGKRMKMWLTGPASRICH